MPDFQLFCLGVAIYLAGMVTGIIIQIARTFSRGSDAEVASQPWESDRHPSPRLRRLETVVPRNE